MLALEWRPRAHLDRESIAIYLGYECGNPQAAIATIRKIDEAIEAVRLLPDTGGHFHAEGLEHEYRIAYADQYLVLYRYTDKMLTVHRVIHQRQDIDTFTLTRF